jgi:hypothetical protein
LWGRTPFEEVAADIEGMEKRVNSAVAPWLDAEGLLDAFADYLVLRRQILAASQRMGFHSVLPRAFPLSWRDRLRPWHVVATPGGTTDEDGAVVFGRKLNVPPGLEAVIPSQITWGQLHSPPTPTQPDVFAPRARAAWLQMLELHGPRAYLMLNGRQHRRMLAPELERPVEEIRALGIPVRFHPRFEWPEARDRETRIREAVMLAEFSGRTGFVCDITGDQIEPEAAAVLTPWEFRRSPLLEQYRQGGNVFHEVQLITDWSDWVVRQDLLA